MSVLYNKTQADYGFNFISGDQIPNGKDEFYLRNEQNPKKNWIALTKEQIQKLEKNGNISENWNTVLVTSEFNPESVKNSYFYGLVRIGNIGKGILQHHDFKIPEGISESRIISCDIGDNCAIHNCPYISHYIIGNNVLLSNVGEIAATNHCKAGNGVVKQGEEENVRIWLDLLNEAGGRSILPFYDMICADAYFWTIYRDDSDFINALFNLTNNSYDLRRGLYGVIGDCTVIKNTQTLKDVNIGSFAYIKGANKLKNLSIKSDKDAATQIGEGVELVNGIIGYGCHIFYGCKAVRFVMGNNSNLKYGARLIHSVLGDNSTVSCCEVLNNLVFPAHEQHHNNSFLIATMIMGQSNMAAGATVGSNHNSRGNDGEIIAGRGFWPGLSSTLKHNSRFACFTLITKGNYPNELNIALPFSMLIENPQHNRLEVMPAYYWMYNMYALERNCWKYKNRDKRKHIEQFTVTDYLAPDTVQEIKSALTLLEEWVGKAAFIYENNNITHNKEELQQKGIDYLLNKSEQVKNLFIEGEHMERSKRPVLIIKAAAAYASYKQMLIYYGVKTIAEYLLNEKTNFTDFAKKIVPELDIFKNQETENWINAGGQLIPEYKADKLKSHIKNGIFKTWKDVHAEYARLWNEYPKDNAVYALHILHFLNQKQLEKADWLKFVEQAKIIRLYIEEQVYKTKLKDYTNSFRNCTYRNIAERVAVLGTVENNPFIKTAQEQTAYFFETLKKIE